MCYLSSNICMCLVKQWLTETCQDVILIFILQEDFLGAFHLDKISGVSGSAVNGARFVRRFVHWKIPRKSGKFKKMGLFSRLGFPNGTSFSVCTFLVVCTSSRSTVGHCHVPGFTTKWNNFLPIGNSTFSPTEISGFFSEMESALYFALSVRRNIKINRTLI